ncbi:UNVERIFIED_CONTAM: hypothetical protein GTU68_009103, partial [Idotea baltica]|nr:hypothetical protein [Idotea baltica]
MDVFQLLGDFLHLIAILLLLLKIIASKTVVGLSYKTQEMFLLVFLTRYSDMLLEHHWGSLYFNLMRFIFIGITAFTIYHMRFKRPYDQEADSFNHYYLYLAAFVLGLVLHSKFSVYGIFQAFSWWLEAVAILPQLYMIARFNDVENITAHIVLFLGLYRAFY